MNFGLHADLTLSVMSINESADMNVSADMNSRAGPVTAREIMSTPVITVMPADSVGEVIQVLTESRISGVVVVGDEGGIVGLVSEHDLLAKNGRTVADVMTTAVMTVSVDSPVEDIRHLLVERRVRRLPVLDRGRLVGVVSRRDVLATLALEWVCGVCGQPVRGTSRPLSCPTCRGAAERFTLEQQPPGP